MGLAFLISFVIHFLVCPRLPSVSHNGMDGGYVYLTLNHFALYSCTRRSHPRSIDVCSFCML